MAAGERRSGSRSPAYREPLLRGRSAELPGEEIVLSSRRPLRVQRSTSSESDVGRKREYYTEEIDHRTHVSMQTPPTLSELLEQTNWGTVMYFSALSLGATFISAAAELPAHWMMPVISGVSLVLFKLLKL